MPRIVVRFRCNEPAAVRFEFHHFPSSFSHPIQHRLGAEVVDARVQADFIQDQHILRHGFVVERLHFWPHVTRRDDVYAGFDGHGGNFRMHERRHHGYDQVAGSDVRVAFGGVFGVNAKRVGGGMSLAFRLSGGFIHVSDMHLPIIALRAFQYHCYQRGAGPTRSQYQYLPHAVIFEVRSQR